MVTNQLLIFLSNHFFRWCSKLKDVYTLIFVLRFFEYGNFFITHISYRHPFLQTSETRPGFHSNMHIVLLFYCIHEKKFIETHKWLFNRMEHIFTDRYPGVCKNSKDTKKVLISDKEFNSDQLWHKGKAVHCWYHLRKNLEFQGTNKHCSEEQLKLLNNNFYNMKISSSEQSYTRRCDEMLQLPHWKNTGMDQYWMKEVERTCCITLAGGSSMTWVLAMTDMG